MSTKTIRSVLSFLSSAALLASSEPTWAELDFGDAGQLNGLWSYPMTLADDGPRHTITPGFYLGAQIDGEIDGKGSLTTSVFTGDDTDNLDDEDGLIFNLPMKRRSTATLSVIVTDDSGLGGFVDIWIDFDASRDWEPGEHLFGGVSQPVVAGTTVLEYVVPEPAPTPASFARVRLSRAGGLPTTGAAPDGEVEDHQGPGFETADTVVTGRLYVDTNDNEAYDDGIDDPVPGVVWLDRDNDGELTSSDYAAVADRQTGIYQIAGRERILSKTLSVLTDNLGRPMIVPVTDFEDVPVTVSPLHRQRDGDSGGPPVFYELLSEEGRRLVASLADIFFPPLDNLIASRSASIPTKGFFQSLTDESGQNYIAVISSDLKASGPRINVLFPVSGLAVPFGMIGISEVDENGILIAVGQANPGPPDFTPKPAVVVIDVANGTATGSLGNLNPSGKPGGLTIENYQAINPAGDRIVAQAVSGFFETHQLVIDRETGAVIHSISPAPFSSIFGPIFLAPGTGGNLLVFHSGNHIRELDSGGTLVGEQTFDDVFGSGSGVFFSGVDAEQNFIHNSHYGNVPGAVLNGPPFPPYPVFNGLGICGTIFQARLELTLGVTSGQPFQIFQSFSGDAYIGAAPPVTITVNPSGSLLGDQDFIITAASVSPPSISRILRNGDGTITVEFSGGTLESGGVLDGTFTPVPGAASPYNFAPVDELLFFLLGN